jgi:hypothetical protein
MHKLARRLSVALVLVIPLATILTIGSADATSTTPPHINITQSGSTYAFSPALVQTTKLSGSCSSTNYNFSVTNTSSRKQTMIPNNSSPGIHLQPSAEAYVCTRPGLTSFHLAAYKHAKLKVYTQP